MSRSGAVQVLALFCFLVACNQERSVAETRSDDSAAVSAHTTVDSFPAVPDSAWIDVSGPTFIGFFRPRTNEELERDFGLTELLDHFAYNLGISTDSLESLGFRVDMSPRDTLWLRAATRRWHFVRDPDSSQVGFYVTSPDGRHTVRYGSGTTFSLRELGREFLRSVPAESR